MPIQVNNPYTGQAQDTCSVSFASQAHVASVHDGQTEAQFNKSKLMGEWGVIKAKVAKGEIPDRTKLLTYEGAHAKGYVYVKGGKIYVRRYAKSTNNMHEFEFDEATQKTYLNADGFKWSIPNAVQPGKPEPIMKKLTGWEPDTDILAGYWGKVTQAKKAGNLPKDTVVAVNPDYMVRLVYNANGTYAVQSENDFGDWEVVEGEGALPYPQQATNLFDDGWKTPPDNDTKPRPTPAAPSQAKPMTKADGKAVQQDDTLKEGDLLAVAKSSSGATEYRIVMGKDSAAEPYLLLAKGPSDSDFKQIDKSDWFPDLIDDGNKWYKPEKNPEPIAAATPAPAVPQNSTSPGSMSHEDVAIMYVTLKDQLAKAKGLNIKGSNPELDQEVYKAIGDAIGYTAPEVKGKIDAYKASGKKLSALKKKVLKNKEPQPAQTATNPKPVPNPNGVPTQANQSSVEDASAAVQQVVQQAPQAFYSNEDIAGAYIMAKDKIVADSGGKWTLYTKNPEMDSAIYKAVKDKTGHSEQEAKHAIAIYLSDPGNKLSKLKKSLIKQGKMKAEADTLKKKVTPAQVQADINSKAATGYTPDGVNNPEAPIADAPFATRGRPKAADLSYTGQTLGTHHAQVWSDKDGNLWLFKPQAQFLNEIDVATANLAKKLGHPAADTYEFTLNNQTGSLQRMFPGGDAFPGGLNPESVPTAHILSVQKEHVLDWLMANHDNHDKNYVLDEYGNIVGIDKGQAAKFLGMDRLHWTFIPNQFEPAPAKLYKAWSEGKNVALNSPKDGELKDFIDKVMAMPDDELKALFRPYAEAAKSKGSLATGQPHWKPEALGQKTIPANDVEAFLNALVKRKNSLDKDFAKLYDEAKKERDKHVKPAATVAQSITNEPGDISHLAESEKENFKLAVGSLFASDPPATIYDKLVAGLAKCKKDNDLTFQKLGQMSVLQAVRIMDELKAKKAFLPNENLYEKKLVAWLTSPEGKKHFQDAKDKEEALAKVDQMKANQPGLPADSAQFTDIEIDEVRKWQKDSTPWTEGQKESLRHYTSNQGYTEMNGNLRGTGYQNDRVGKHVERARAGMRPLHRAVTTHRGTTAISFGLAENGENDLLYGLIGKTCTQVGFSSSSFGQTAGFGSKPVIIHFECPPGMPAAFVKDISHYGSENEILLDHNLTVRVLKVWETSGGWSKQYHVQVRVEGWEDSA